jgi:hypothetical protein
MPPVRRCDRTTGDPPWEDGWTAPYSAIGAELYLSRAAPNARPEYGHEARCQQLGHLSLPEERGMLGPDVPCHEVGTHRMRGAGAAEHRRFRAMPLREITNRRC